MQKRVNILITFTAKVLEFVGKPFFITLKYSFLLTALILYITGHLSRVVLLGVVKSTSLIIAKILSLALLASERVHSIFRKISKKNKSNLIKATGLRFSRERKSKNNADARKLVKIFLLKSKLYILTIYRAPRFLLIKRHQKIYGLGLTIAAVPLLIIVGIWSLFLQDLPSPESLTTRELQVSTKIYDRNNELLYKIFKDENRTPLPLKEIPQQVVLATLAIEDSDFYNHPGFSVKGIVRALVKNYQDGTLSGGSTITQQLVKNTLLSSEKTFERKLKEFVLALQVERIFTKDEILEMYLNEVSFGGTAYGIQEAAQYYFNKDAVNLTISEAALLAGLPKSPSTNSPFGSKPKAAIDRQKEVLRLMEENGYISSEQRQKSEEESLNFAPNVTNIQSPHFVMYVRDYLEKKYGKAVVEKGGLEVVTSLDLRVQNLAEKAIEEELENLGRLNVGNAGVVVLDPKTGEILAMAGSRDYFDTENDGNVNVTVAERQPGSSIKVVTYAHALENGMTAASIINDSPITYPVIGHGPYSPKNYDGNFRGNITLRSSLAESRNIPAVKTLEKFGVQSMINEGKAMGITTWTDPNRYGLSLALGGGEVKLTDMAIVYSTLANYGKRPTLSPIVSIHNYKGIAIYPQEKSNNLANNFFRVSADEVESDQKVKTIQAIDPKVAFIITDILKDNGARSPAFGSRSLLNIKDHPEVAVKTGTSNSLRDNLAIGYTNDYVVAVWVGNNDNTPMHRVASGLTGATPIFNKVMTGLLEDTESTEWVAPDGVVQVNICPKTGTLACGGCSKPEWFIEGTEPKGKCAFDKLPENQDLENKNIQDR